MAVPAQYSADGTVLAWMRLDGGSRIPMDVDEANETVSGVFNSVSFGDHTIEIIVEFDADAFGVLELARTTLPVTVSGGTTTISFEQNDYTYAHSDNDTYPNVVELMVDPPTDPFDENSFPDDGSLPDSGRWNLMVWDQTNWR
jgi:hypothetical protein